MSSTSWPTHAPPTRSSQWNDGSLPEMVSEICGGGEGPAKPWSVRSVTSYRRLSPKLPSREIVATLTNQMACAARTRSSKWGSSPAVPGTNAVSNKCPENASSSSAASSAPYSGRCDTSVGGGGFAQATSTSAPAASTQRRDARRAGPAESLLRDASFDLFEEQLRRTVRLS